MTKMTIEYQTDKVEQRKRLLAVRFPKHKKVNILTVISIVNYVD